MNRRDIPGVFLPHWSTTSPRQPHSWQLRVLIVEESRLAAESLTFALDSNPLLDSVGYSLERAEALELVVAYEPDAVVVGWNIDDAAQLELCERIHDLSPHVRLIALRRKLVPHEVEELFRREPRNVSRRRARPTSCCTRSPTQTRASSCTNGHGARQSSAPCGSSFQISLPMHTRRYPTDTGRRNEAELETVFQPLIDLTSQNCVAYEALTASRTIRHGRRASGSPQRETPALPSCSETKGRTGARDRARDTGRRIPRSLFSRSVSMCPKRAMCTGLGLPKAVTPGTALTPRRPADAPTAPSVTAPRPDSERPHTALGTPAPTVTLPVLSQQPLRHTIKQASSAVSKMALKTVSEASKTVSQASQILSPPLEQMESTAADAVGQTETTVSDAAAAIVGTAAPTTDTTTTPTATAPAPSAAVQQTVTDVASTASNAASQLLGHVIDGP